MAFQSWRRVAAGSIAVASLLMSFAVIGGSFSQGKFITCGELNQWVVWVEIPLIFWCIAELLLWMKEEGEKIAKEG